MLVGCGAQLGTGFESRPNWMFVIEAVHIGYVAPRPVLCSVADGTVDYKEALKSFYKSRA